MTVWVNAMAAVLLTVTIAFYVFIYTIWLKRRTPQNIVIGGASGALPPMIGWAAVTGGISIEPVILFAIIFLWTPPHFWALALYRSGDYERAGVPRTVVDKAGQVLAELEAGEQSGAIARLSDGLPLFTVVPKPAPAPESEVEAALAQADPDALSPRDALELIYRLRGILKSTH